MSRADVRSRGSWGSASCCWAASARVARADEPRLADYFGFLPLEVYKLDARISNLLLKDLDGDKVDDIVVVNNGRSRIDLLLERQEGRRR